MPNPPVTFQVTATPYGPEQSDDNPAAYLTRCGEAMLEAYGYQYNVMAAANDPADLEQGVMRQLQITIPDDVPGGHRAVIINAPETIMDLGGDVMAASTFHARYGTG